MSRRRKGESPSQFRARKRGEDQDQGGFWESFGEGLGIVLGALATADEVAERSERRRLHQEIEEEERRAKDRVIERMASNWRDHSPYETRESVETRYVVERLHDINQQLKAERSFFKKQLLLDEKQRLERKLGLL